MIYCKIYCECCTSKKNKNNNKSLVSKLLLVLSKSTNNTTLLLITINLPHQQVWKFCQIFSVYKISKKRKNLT